MLHQQQRKFTVVFSNYSVAFYPFFIVLSRKDNNKQSSALTIVLDCDISYTGCLQKNGAVSKVNNTFTSHLTRAQLTPSVAATVLVSHALPAVRFSCLLRGKFTKWRRSRKSLSVCSILRCPDL